MTPKPSRVFGTASRAQRACAVPSTPRPWVEDLYKKLTRADRDEMARRAALVGVEVSVKYQKADGTLGVSCAQEGFSQYIRACTFLFF